MYLTQAAMLEKYLLFPFPFGEKAMLALMLGGPLDSIGGSGYRARASRTLDFSFPPFGTSVSQIYFFSCPHLSLFRSSFSSAPLLLQLRSSLYLTQVAMPVLYLLFPFPFGENGMVALMLGGPLNAIAGSWSCARASRTQCFIWPPFGTRLPQRYYLFFLHIYLFPGHPSPLSFSSCSSGRPCI